MTAGRNNFISGLTVSALIIYSGITVKYGWLVLMLYVSLWLTYDSLLERLTSALCIAKY